MYNLYNSYYHHCHLHRHILHYPDLEHDQELERVGEGCVGVEGGLGIGETREGNKNKNVREALK